jgi:DNA-directed RNA polymerase specialized sigma subunit
VTDELHRILTEPEKLEVRIHRLALEREEIMAAVESAKAIQTDADKVQSSPRSDAIPRAVANAEAKDDEIAGLELRRQLAIAERSRLVGALADPAQEHVITARYISRMTWEQIGEDMGYSDRQCRRIFHDAIDFLEDQIKDVRKCPTRPC